MVWYYLIMNISLSVNGLLFSSLPLPLYPEPPRAQAASLKQGKMLLLLWLLLLLLLEVAAISPRSRVKHKRNNFYSVSERVPVFVWSRLQTGLDWEGDPWLLWSVFLPEIGTATVTACLVILRGDLTRLRLRLRLLEHTALETGGHISGVGSHGMGIGLDGICGDTNTESLR